MDAPKPTGKISAVTVTGSLMPWKEGQPVFMMVQGSPHTYLPLFSTEEELRQVMGDLGVTDYSMKMVENLEEFLASVPPEIPVIFNPHRVGDKTRWTELQR
jgi:hypothetical protein